MVEAAIEAASPGVRYSAKIDVISASRFAATLVVNGQTLATQNFAVMDRNLSEQSFARFASALAKTVASAAKS